ncbi:hypothetical protein [Endozoicomonas lisbonensis]|uniref:Uncharacterized protein n=1 Tax=Endozoicomonas lisbonensis TaxID=3120522 RepID=A0ABV2SMP5_9GAMM
MEPSRPSSPTDSLPFYDALESLPRPDTSSSDPSHEHRKVDTVDLNQVFRQIPSRKDDGTTDSFKPIQKMQVDIQQPQPGRLQRAFGWFWGTSPEQAEGTSKAATPETSGSGNWIVQGLKNYIISPVRDFLIKPLAERVVKPVANQVIAKPFKHFIVPQAQKRAANLARYQLLEKWAGVTFDMTDETWQQIFTDILLTAFKDLDPQKAGIYQHLKIPKLTIETQNGPLVVSNLSLSACLQPPGSESTEIQDQQRQTTISIHQVRCDVDIPVEYQEEPVSLKVATNLGEVHLGTDIGKFLNFTSAYTWLREGKNSPNLPRDNTAVQVSLTELEVKYSNTNTAYALDGEYADPASKLPGLAEFDKGTAIFKDLKISKKINLIHQEADQSAVTTMGGMEIDFDADDDRPSVVALNKIALSDMDKDHNGSLSCELTLEPKHLKLSSSLLLRLLGTLLGGKTKLSLHAPVRKGDIALKDLKHSRKQLEKLSDRERQDKGYIEVESSNPLIKLILGPLLRSRFTRITQTANGSSIQVGAQIEVQLPGLIPGSGKEDDHGTIVMTELFDQIGGDLLQYWSLINSRLLICPKRLEQQCILASREKATDPTSPEQSRQLVMMYKELKQRQHHREALRACLAITAPVYKKLILECDDPVERAEYYKIAHELTEVDPPKSVAIFAALLQRKHYAEVPETADPDWLTEKALDFEREEPDNIELVIDTLSFAYKSGPFAGSEAMCQLLRLVKEGRCPGEVVTQLICDHVKSGRFEGSPKALAQTVDAIESVVGESVVQILREYPTRPLADLSAIDPEAPELINRISNLMQRYKLPVPSAELHLHIQGEFAAEQILETGIQNHNPDALKARIRWEIKDGSIGYPRYIDAARLLLETLSNPELPAEMKEAGKEAFHELWQHTHEKPEVATAFCHSFNTSDDHPYNRFVQQLFSIPRELTLTPDEFVNKIHEMRPLLLQAKETDDIAPAQLEMINHFATLLNNLQALNDQARLSTLLIQQMQTGQQTVQSLLPAAITPVRANLNRGHRSTNVPEATPDWMQEATDRRQPN